MAGSGSTAPLVQRLALALPPQSSRPIYVAQSVGTGGGLRALKDGLIDLALASRPLTPQERGDGLQDLPLARSLLVFAVHPDARAPRATSEAELEAMYQGRLPRWPSGEPVVLLVREQGDSGMLLLAERSPKLHRAMQEARAQGRALEFETDTDMLHALATIRGSLGPIDLGLLQLGEPTPALPLALGDTLPSPETAAQGRWPWLKPLLLVTRGAPSPQLAPFLSFIHTQEVRDALPAGGYLPPAP
jgi:phosphate transport system substrate-binding protein